MRLVLRVLFNAAAIWLASVLISGFTFSGNWINLIIVAIIFGLVNAFVRPIVKLLTLPLNILTLGLFTLVINTLMLMLTAWLSGSLSLEGGLFASTFTACIAAILISVISTVLSWLLPDKGD